MLTQMDRIYQSKQLLQWSNIILLDSPPYQTVTSIHQRFWRKTYAGWQSPSEEAVLKAVMEKTAGTFQTDNGRKQWRRPESLGKSSDIQWYLKVGIWSKQRSGYWTKLYPIERIRWTVRLLYSGNYYEWSTDQKWSRIGTVFYGCHEKAIRKLLRIQMTVLNCCKICKENDRTF